jgi:hypothetical protein
MCSRFRRVRDRAIRGRLAELPPIAGLALLLLAFLLALFVVRGFGLPVGPDGPVYLWWARLAGQEGLSTMERPGVPAISLLLQGTLHVPLVAALGALQCVLGGSLGLAAAMVLRAADREDWQAWLLGGALAGVFAVHLVSGYLANLGLGVTFLAAAAALALGHRRGAVAAALLLAVGAAFHPQFYLVGLAILAGTAALSLRDPDEGKDERRRIAIAAAGSAVLVGAGWLALLRGPGPPDVDTSRDAFLRRVGMTDTLRHLFRDRFVHRATRYVQWISVPLAVVGLPKVRGFVARFLASWGIVTIAGIVVGLVTGLLPPDRFVTFGYVVPMLTGVGAIRVGRAVTNRTLAVGLVALLVVLMVLGALFAWRREKPYLTEEQIAQVTSASRLLERTPAGTPAFFYVETGDPTITFFATQAENAIRAAVPPDRIRDVHLLFFPAERATDERRLLFDGATKVFEAANDRARAGLAPPPIRFALSSFILPAGLYETQVAGLGSALGADVEIVEPGVAAAPPSRLGVGAVPDPLEPSSPGQIVLATFLGLVLCSGVGFGWARASGFDRVAAAALSPAVGLAALTLAGIAAERLGVPLTGSIGPTAVSVVVGLGGYLAHVVLERRAGREPSA